MVMHRVFTQTTPCAKDSLMAQLSLLFLFYLKKNLILLSGEKNHEVSPAWFV